MSSIWHQSARCVSKPPLNKDIKTEIAVIGGGLTGILTASLLAAEGKQVTVLDAASIGSGQTGSTTAKVTSQHGDIYHKLEQTLGTDTAGQYAEANQKAIRSYRQLIRERNIQCDWEDTEACLYSTESNEPLLVEAEAQKRAGLNARFSEKTDLPFAVRGVVRLGAQGMLHPLKLLYALAEDLNIYENTRVLNVENDRITTESGCVQSEHIVFACHYPFINWPGAYFMRMHQERSYVLALTGAPKLTAYYYSVDPGGLSLRPAGEYLLLGGGSHRTGEAAAEPYDALRRSAAMLFPESREAVRWSAQDCITLDGIPYIGQFSASTPNWYVATGFGKWGMTSAMVAAELNRDIILGRSSSGDSIFSPQRFNPAPSILSLLNECIHSVRGLTRQLFAPARTAADILPPDHGGVVEVAGEKVGLYKSPQGEIWLVDIHCPHLGCELTWNNAEKSWDCPCHGSRYDYRGKLLDGPAQTSLSAIRL